MREVTAAGARPRRTALHGLEALTPRELQTAGLAAEGKSNREIADALFVTVKTVEWHLKHCYGKLGISLAARAGRRSRTQVPGRLTPAPDSLGAGAEGNNRPRWRDRSEASKGLVRCGRYTPQLAVMPAGWCNET